MTTSVGHFGPFISIFSWKINRSTKIHFTFSVPPPFSGWHLLKMLQSRKKLSDFKEGGIENRVFFFFGSQFGLSGSPKIVKILTHFFLRKLEHFSFSALTDTDFADQAWTVQLNLKLFVVLKNNESSWRAFNRPKDRVLKLIIRGNL